MVHYARAARICPLDGPKVGETAVARMKTLLLRPLDADGEEGELMPTHREALGRAATIAVGKVPTEAGTVACQLAPTISAVPKHRSIVDPRRVATAVIAWTKKRA